MTDVHFYFNVPHKLAFACRLARKAFAQGKSMVITAPPAHLHQLDEMLWTMEPADFLAHDVLGTPGEAAALAVVAPITLAEQVDAQRLGGSVHGLVSLWDEVPAGFSHFEHVYELVLHSDEADRQHGRQRWRYYQQRGYPLHGHDLARPSP